MQLPRCSPNPIAHAERLIQTIRVGCLNRCIIPGARHSDHLVTEFMEHCNRERPHSGIGRRVPVAAGPPGEGRVVC